MIQLQARGLIVALALLAALPARADLALYMIEQRGCAWCRQWDRDVSQAYQASDTGALAPLMRLDIRDAVPDGVRFASRPVFTPTFILVQDGAEVGRIEGYLSADFFWQHMDRLLDNVANP